jgi:AcrR family transcriptional regulator
VPSTAEVAQRQVADGRRTDTRARLLVEAAGLFGDKGYAATSVADLESAVGLKPGSGGLYRHFSSKEELLLATVTAYRDRVQLVRAGVAEEFGEGPGDPAVELARVLEVLSDFMSGEQPMIRIGVDAAALPGAALEVLGESWDDGHGIFVDLFIRYGHDEESASMHAVAALGSLYHYIAYLGSLGTEPLGIPLERYVVSWVTQWAAVAREVHE